MKKDKKVTEVIFYRELPQPESAQGFEFSGDIMAYFPKERFCHKGHPNYNKMFTCYAHIGQHSACEIDYLLDRSKCEPCESEGEFKDLKMELKGLGYNLKVKNCLIEK
jgi:hypothetical protein